MNWRQTTINRPGEAQALLSAIADVQRERFTSRTNTLLSQGVEPGNAWQAAATHQRTADLPNYEPTVDEQMVLATVANQLEGDDMSLDSAESSVQLDAALAGGGADSEDGSSGGIKPEVSPAIDFSTDDELAGEMSPQAAAAQPLPRPSRDLGGDRSNDSGSDDTADTDARAEDILDNARQFLDAAAALSQEEGVEVNATNETYLISRDRRGVVTLENRKTGGFLIGDEQGIRNSDGLTAADQTAWSNYGQIQTNELQEQQRRQRQRRERERQTDIEL